jgi:hypothetical protein
MIKKVLVNKRTKPSCSPIALLIPLQSLPFGQDQRVTQEVMQREVLTF